MPKIPQPLVKSTQPPNDLLILERCRQELASMQNLSSVLEMRDRATAIKAYMRAKGDARESQNSAACIAALAEARAGQLINEGRKEGSILPTAGGAPKGNKNRAKETTLPNPKGCSNPKPAGPASIGDLGLDYHESSRLQYAAEVMEKDPEWFDNYRDECSKKGRDFTQQAVIRRGKEIKNGEVSSVEVETPKNLYDVIVMDPPWPTVRVEMEVRPQVSNIGFDYPVMTEDELKVINVPAADDCHLWMWTTQRFLPMALRIAPIWGFRYSCTFVWHKNKGMQLFKQPYYNCEFAVYFRKGNPKFRTTKDFKTCHQWPNAKHSEKPKEFYDLVNRVTEGRRLDMFNRRVIEGFDGWGNEAKKNSAHEDGVDSAE